MTAISLATVGAAADADITEHSQNRPLPRFCSLHSYRCRRRRFVVRRDVLGLGKKRLREHPRQGGMFGLGEFPKPELDRIHSRSGMFAIRAEHTIPPRKDC